MDIEKNNDEIPAGLPKQFSESLKRIGEQAKEWQTKKLDAPATEEPLAAPVGTKAKVAASTPAPNPVIVAPAPVVATAAPIASKAPFNWSATSLAMTVLVLLALVFQTVWFAQKFESLNVANKDLQMQVQGLTEEFRTLQETVKAQTTPPAPPSEAAPQTEPSPAAQQPAAPNP